MRWWPSWSKCSVARRQAQFAVDIHIGKRDLGLGPAEGDKWKLIFEQKVDARVAVIDARQDEAVHAPAVDQLAIGAHLVVSLR
jgi:hypothetical protein